MKITCVCGQLIPDQTDFISYKAWIIADQDWYDALAGAPDDAWRLSRTMWQCRSCRRLYIDDRDGNLHRFDPAEPTVPDNLLASKLGAHWKGMLRGHWRKPASWLREQGEVWWQCGDGDAGFEKITSRGEVIRRYHEEFERLRSNDTLRDAFLDDTEHGDPAERWILHRWPPTGGAEPTP
jgi:hypothetical protein